MANRNQIMNGFLRGGPATDDLRREIGAKYGLPADTIPAGDDAAAMDASARALAKRLGAQAPAGSVDGGARGAAPAQNASEAMTAWIRGR